MFWSAVIKNNSLRYNKKNMYTIKIRNTLRNLIYSFTATNTTSSCMQQCYIVFSITFTTVRSASSWTIDCVWIVHESIITNRQYVNNNNNNNSPTGGELVQFCHSAALSRMTQLNSLWSQIQKVNWLGPQISSLVIFEDYTWRQNKKETKQKTTTRVKAGTDEDRN